MSIEKIWAREILDSRGNPTVEVDLHTAKGNGHLPTAPELGVRAWDGRIPSGGALLGQAQEPRVWEQTFLVQGSRDKPVSVCWFIVCALCVCAPYVYALWSYDGEFRLPLVLAQASPIFHSSCEGKLGIALE